VAGTVPLPAPERALLQEHVEHRLGQGGGYYVELYRTTVDLLRQLGGARFVMLDAADRVALVSRHRLAVADLRPGVMVEVKPAEHPGGVGSGPAEWIKVEVSAP